MNDSPRLIGRKEAAAQHHLANTGRGGKISYMPEEWRWRTP